VISNANNDEMFASLGRLFTLRRKTINCCQSAAFSASSRLFALNGEAKMARTKEISAIIQLGSPILSLHQHG